MAGDAALCGSAASEPVADEPLASDATPADEQVTAEKHETAD